MAHNYIYCLLYKVFNIHETEIAHNYILCYQTTQAKLGADAGFTLVWHYLTQIFYQGVPYSGRANETL